MIETNHHLSHIEKLKILKQGKLAISFNILKLL
jgi:hypothetical protein